jgi:hypothetical protein
MDIRFNRLSVWQQNLHQLQMSIGKKSQKYKYIYKYRGFETR